MEFQDLDITFYSEDGTFNQNGPVATWIRECCDVVEETGSTLCPGPRLKGWVEAAGFKNIVHEKFPLPIGLWPKDQTLVG